MREKIPGEDALMYALEYSDEKNRESRAARIKWAQTYKPALGLIVGPVELMNLIEEAHLCYISGHFISVLILCTAAIEQIIADELVEKKLGSYGTNFTDAIAQSKQNNLFPLDLLEAAEKLRLVRNPYMHLKRAGHAHSLGTRFSQQSRHPRTIQEEDAQLALSTMFRMFESNLRNGA